MWINGPFPCGEWPDLRIARNEIIFLLDQDEKILADGGYNEKSCRIPSDSRCGRYLASINSIMLLVTHLTMAAGIDDTDQKRRTFQIEYFDDYEEEEEN